MQLNFSTQKKQYNPDKIQNHKLRNKNKIQTQTSLSQQTYQINDKNTIQSSWSSDKIFSTSAGSDRSQKQNLSIGVFCDNRIIKRNNNHLTKLKNGFSKVTIQHFDVLDLCGHGIEGSVFLAKHKSTNHLSALKKVLKSSLANQDDKQSLVRQIKIHNRLNHPNIVKFYGCFSDKKAIYLVLQLCKDGNLYERLQKEGMFEQKQVRRIMRQVCSGIDYLHRNNIIHRDIKAENIIFQNQVIKICDFGLAIQAQSCKSYLCGTPVYFSPQIVQKKQYNHKVDIWSMGILVFELLYGRIPFKIQVETDLNKIVEQQILFPSEIKISEHCKNFILKCLEKTTQMRWDASSLSSHPFLKIKH